MNVVSSEPFYYSTWSKSYKCDKAKLNLKEGIGDKICCHKVVREIECLLHGGFDVQVAENPLSES